MSRSTTADYASFPDGLLEDWDRIEALDLPRGHDLYEDVFAGPAFPLQRKRELAAMTRLIRAEKPSSYFEIGADKGGTLFNVVAGCPTLKRVYACEIRGCPYKEHFDRMFPYVEFVWFECPSSEAKILRPLDAVFIDGDKCQFANDFHRFPAKLAVMHDVCDEPMRSQWLACGGSAEEHKDVSEWDEEERRLHLPPETAWHGWLRHWRSTSCTFGVVRRSTS